MSDIRDTLLLDDSQLMRPDDPGALRDRIYDSVLSGIRQIAPVTNAQGMMLSIHDADYVDPPTRSIADQKQAILSGQSLNRRLRGTLRLSGPGGEVLDEKQTTLARVPYMTQRGTFILNGTSYTTARQPRLLPGGYTRRRSSGELEAHINVAKGLGHKLFLEPATGVFRMSIDQSNLPLISVLRIMGTPEEDIRQAWGDEIYTTNSKKDDSRVLNKLYGKLRKFGKAASRDEQIAEIREAFNSMELDPQVTELTLGKPLTTITPETMLRATSKLLDISNGAAEVDDRDAWPYQTVADAATILADRFKRGQKLLTGMLWKAAAKGKLGSQVAPFDALIKPLLLNSGLTNPVEEINPAEIYDHQSRMTRLGEGGIPSVDAVPEESRAIHPTQYGLVDILRTPESERVGVDIRLASGARLGHDGKLYAPVVDIRDGSRKYANARQLYGLVAALPGEMQTDGSIVNAVVRGKIKPVSREQVQVEFPAVPEASSTLTNLLPFLSSLQGQRGVMGTRMLTQALPLPAAETPLVQTATSDDLAESYEERFGQHLGALRSSIGGQIKEVTADKIVVHDPQTGRDEEHELYNRFPFNRKTMLHQTPTVKVGDVIQPNQLIARSNFTDDRGRMAMGLNARVAYLPWKGYNFEDAIVVSESFAKRATSEHLYQHNYTPTDKDVFGRDQFVSLFPQAIDRKTYDTFDADGVVKPGTILQKGQPMILAATPRTLNRKSMLRLGAPRFKDASVVWDHSQPGEVVDVVRSKSGPTVVVKSHDALQVGDKLSGLYGDKGVIAAVVPDSDMPTDEEGQTFEVMLNPAGITSRRNPAQILAAALGKLAAKRGYPYKIPSFDPQDMTEFVNRELEQAGEKFTENLRDPDKGITIPDVFTGNRFLMKLHHTSESKGQARSLGRYAADQTPAKGGDEGARSKRIGMLEVNALLSSGASKFLRESGLIRGQASPEYWAAYRAGRTPPTPEVPWVYRQFVNNLKASGINVVRQGHRSQIMPMTDKHINDLAGDREIQNGETVDWQTMEPVPGGLFDRSLTGGHLSADGGGNRWSYIRLSEPMPSPVMEEPIRRILGLTKPKFEAILSGRDELQGQTGAKAIYTALDKLDLNQEIAQARAAIAGTVKTHRDVAVRKLGYLRAAQRLDMHPRDWMIRKMPVLPPAFRPVSVMGESNIPLVADPNYLYKELLEGTKAATAAQHYFGNSDQERLLIYKSMKAIAGLGDPVKAKNAERGVRGILKHVFGTSPKYGAVQRSLLGGTVDLVGRAVISPDPDLDMDEVAIPEDKAWEVFAPRLIRRMVRRGLDKSETEKQIEARSPKLLPDLVDEMSNSLVVISRAPALHRYGVMAFRPKLTKHHTMKVSPLVVSGFGADFDGDAMQYHVPINPDVEKELAEKLLPSKNLLNVAHFEAHQLPSQEYVGGLYTATSARTRRNKPSSRLFASIKDAIAAYNRGEIEVNSEVTIAGDRSEGSSS